MFQRVLFITDAKVGDPSAQPESTALSVVGGNGRFPCDVSEEILSLWEEVIALECSCVLLLTIVDAVGEEDAKY